MRKNSPHRHSRDEMTGKKQLGFVQSLLMPERIQISDRSS